MPRLSRIPPGFTVLVAAATLAACSKADQASKDATPAATAAATDTSHAAMPGMGAGMQMTGDADRDFLRMMSDHHKGLSTMAHEAIESKDKITVKDVATRLDTKQDGELDKMGKMLETDYKDVYAPMIMPDNQAMIDALKGKTAKDFDRTFLQNVITHHEQAIKMIDDYLPKAKAPAVKAMAEKMKADQTQEISEFKGRLAKLG